MRPLLLACLFWLALSVPGARAHPLSPASVELVEQAALSYRVTFRRSAALASALVLSLPPDCTATQVAQTRQGELLVERSQVRCKAPLDGRTIRVLGLAELSLGAVVHARFLDGRSVQALLGPERASIALPRRTVRLEIARDYVLLGVEHLLTGLDHVLFVVGLLWLVPVPRRLLLTLTAFTVGHSVTLCLAALGLVQLPQGPVELGIALSIVCIAWELTRPGSVRRVPLWQLSLVTVALGLLHGLGFAGALSDTGLPAHQLPLSLFSFNLGVELGQLAVVLLLAPALWLAHRLNARHAQRLRMAIAYGIGCTAAMWCIERALSMWRIT